eukprot:SM000305S11816  [mRNA]  locus=s305:95559:97960:- [translate_table: standard]
MAGVDGSEGGEGGESSLTLDRDLWAFVLPDDTARAFLERCHMAPLRTSVPFLDMVRLRRGHSIVEISGASGSAKTEVLVQVAATCLLPKQVDGGNEGAVLYFDLDFKFDILRLVNILKARIREARGAQAVEALQQVRNEAYKSEEHKLLEACLSRFYVAQPRSTFAFLIALKSLRPKLEDIVSSHGKGSIQLLAIDSIGAFHWLDRGARATTMPGTPKSTVLSSTVASQAIVMHLRQHLRTYRMLVLASKCTIFTGSGYSHKQASRASTNSSYNGEYLPAVWQQFVTDRVHLQGPRPDIGPEAQHVFTAEWLSPAHHVGQMFVLEEVPGEFVSFIKLRADI